MVSATYLQLGPGYHRLKWLEELQGEQSTTWDQVERYNLQPPHHRSFSSPFLPNSESLLWQLEWALSTPQTGDWPG